MATAASKMTLTSKFNEIQREYPSRLCWNGHVRSRYNQHLQNQKKKEKPMLFTCNPFYFKKMCPQINRQPNGEKKSKYKRFLEPILSELKSRPQPHTRCTPSSSSRLLSQPPPYPLFRPTPLRRLINAASPDLPARDKSVRRATTAPRAQHHRRPFLP